MTHAVNIAVAFPRNAAKEIARAIGCSHSQAERIAKTGYIPERLWSAAEQILERALDAWEEKIRQEREKLKVIRYQRMVSRAEDRRDDSACSLRAVAAESDEGAEQLPLIGDAA